MKRLCGFISAVVVLISATVACAQQKTYEIYGAVSYPDGAPAPGVRLSITVGCDKSETVTDQDGNYKVSVQGDLVFIQAAHGDYVLGDYVRPSENQGQSIRKDIRLEFACLVLGEVTDASTGMPIEGGDVRVSGGAFLIDTKTGSL